MIIAIAAAACIGIGTGSWWIGVGVFLALVDVFDSARRARR